MKLNYIFPSLLLTAIGFGATSCEQYLEEELVSGVSAATYYPTVAGFEDAVKATYSFMKPFYGVERGFTMTVFGTDTYTNGADGSYKGFNAYDGRLNGADAFVRDTWRDLYRGVNQANAVINRSQTLEELSEEDKTNRLAEVRFLRGMYYFDLVRMYGDVHLSLEETQGIEVEANRTPQSEIYAQAIVPDLEFAIANLPPSQAEYGRATKPAAEMLLAKVLLRRSYTNFAESGDAARAETLFTNVIENYDFRLLDDYADLWNIDNEQNSEVVFAVQNNKGQVDEGLDGNGNRGHLYFLFEYDVQAGMLRDTENGRPWKRFKPTDYTMSLWDRSVDTRYDKSFKHVWYANNEATIPTWTAADAAAGYGTEGQPKFAVGDTAVFIPGPGMDAYWTPERQAAAPYLVFTSDEYTERNFPTLKKWVDPTRPNRQHEPGQRDMILMRLGDAYLLRAEARLKQGDTEGAAEDINVIRVRGAVEGMEEAVMITAADVTLDFLLDERGRELVGEGHRWFDLTRTNTLVERVREHNPIGGPNIQDHHVLRPIPQDQIDRTQGGYPQNPGYLN
ncbi:RagB/SusD domain-containing protein [Neolewinella xylanilytica]|uniref:RagB/SusD domain-containing protein n=1 Tax=Neolewinella xylanilytica TaxID=1514080 RepID=A0A2S6IB51_9BACT|nr:RagB/SusD family nutrient uptake outer membrane protein [Neolewinella xylanilytica]PPK88692.1 RagB/SusD domain-containing protein [Neolewinella xylanilytica]